MNVCRGIFRWLCGGRIQKQLAKASTQRLHQERAASLGATQALRRKSLREVLYGEDPGGPQP